MDGVQLRFLFSLNITRYLKWLDCFILGVILYLFSGCSAKVDIAIPSSSLQDVNIPVVSPTQRSIFHEDSTVLTEQNVYHSDDDLGKVTYTIWDKITGGVSHQWVMISAHLDSKCSQSASQVGRLKGFPRDQWGNISSPSNHSGHITFYGLSFQNTSGSNQYIYLLAKANAGIWIYDCWGPFLVKASNNMMSSTYASNTSNGTNIAPINNNTSAQIASPLFLTPVPTQAPVLTSTSTSAPVSTPPATTPMLNNTSAASTTIAVAAAVTPLAALTPTPAVTASASVAVTQAASPPTAVSTPIPSSTSTVTVASSSSSALASSSTLVSSTTSASTSPAPPTLTLSIQRSIYHTDSTLIERKIYNSSTDLGSIRYNVEDSETGGVANQWVGLSAYTDAQCSQSASAIGKFSANTIDQSGSISATTDELGYVTFHELSFDNTSGSDQYIYLLAQSNPSIWVYDCWGPFKIEPNWINSYSSSYKSSYNFYTYNYIDPNDFSFSYNSSNSFGYSLNESSGGMNNGSYNYNNHSYSDSSNYNASFSYRYYRSGDSYSYNTSHSSYDSSSNSSVYTNPSGQTISYSNYNSSGVNNNYGSYGNDYFNYGLNDSHSYNSYGYNNSNSYSYNNYSNSYSNHEYSNPYNYNNGSSSSSGSPSQLRISGPSSYTPGSCLGPFYIYAQDGNGHEAKIQTPLTVNLSANPTGGTFYSDSSSCSHTISSISISSGSSSSTTSPVFYKSPLVYDDLVIKASDATSQLYSGTFTLMNSAYSNSYYSSNNNSYSYSNYEDDHSSNHSSPYSYTGYSNNYDSSYSNYGYNNSYSYNNDSYSNNNFSTNNYSYGGSGSYSNNYYSNNFGGTHAYGATTSPHYCARVSLQPTPAAKWRHDQNNNKFGTYLWTFDSTGNSLQGFDNQGSSGNAPQCTFFYYYDDHGNKDLDVDLTQGIVLSASSMQLFNPGNSMQESSSATTIHISGSINSSMYNDVASYFQIQCSRSYQDFTPLTEADITKLTQGSIQFRTCDHEL